MQTWKLFYASLTIYHKNTEVRCRLSLMGTLMLAVLCLGVLVKIKIRIFYIHKQSQKRGRQKHNCYQHIKGLHCNLLQMRKRWTKGRMDNILTEMEITNLSLWRTRKALYYTGHLRDQRKANEEDKFESHVGSKIMRGRLHPITCFLKPKIKKKSKTKSIFFFILIFS